MSVKDINKDIVDKNYCGYFRVKRGTRSSGTSST